MNKQTVAQLAIDYGKLSATGIKALTALIERVEDVEKDNRELTIENNELCVALEFYGDEYNYDTKVVINPGRNNHYKEISCDRGHIARQALAGKSNMERVENA